MSKSEGILKLSFKSEEAAKNFASNWQECNGNFLIDAEITEVSSLDELTYNVKLNADCVASLVPSQRLGTLSNLEALPHPSQINQLNRQ
jgi:hypothetical protein